MRASVWRVYLNVFDDNGNYTSFQDVTEDVELDSLGTIDFALDNTDYNIGVYRNSNLSVTFRNDSGKYSDVGQPNSIFQYARTNSLFRITWQGNDKPLNCGFFLAGGEVLCPELTVFEGLLDDSTLTMDMSTQELAFTVLGKESLMNNTTIPEALAAPFAQTVTVAIGTPGVFTTPLAHGLGVNDPVLFATNGGTLSANLDPTSTYWVIRALSPTTFTISSSFSGAELQISDIGSGTTDMFQASGQNFSALIYAFLNQAGITKLLTVNQSNINVGQDFEADNSSGFINMTVWDAMADLLLLTNSVLYILNDTVFVSARTMNPTLAFTFYGQSSINGPENIQDIQNIAGGIARTFNYLYWTPSDVVVSNPTSIAKYNTIQKEFDYDYIFNTTEQATILTGILNEFGLPKQEMDIYTPLNFQSIQLFLLDQIAIDFPPQYLPGPMGLPVCGQAICGECETPSAIWSFIEIPTTQYKIEGTSIDPQTDLICVSVRKV